MAAAHKTTLIVHERHSVDHLTLFCFDMKSSRLFRYKLNGLSRDQVVRLTVVVNAQVFFSTIEIAENDDSRIG